MIEITGKYATAIVYTSILDEMSEQQILTLCDQPFVVDSKIRLMPDVHAGMGCTIGTTMTISDKVVPNLVGVDIGCGMETLIVNTNSDISKNFDPPKLDEIIHKNIPSGFDIRKTEHEFLSKVPLDQIRCPKYTLTRAKKSIGTLGGGNHFIEANRDDEGTLYIVIHSGSRHLGHEIAEYYQKMAWKQINGSLESDINRMIESYKAEGRFTEISEKVKQLSEQVITDIPKSLAYLTGSLYDDYIADMQITQHFANINRKAMMSVLVENLDIQQCDIVDQFTTIHNYIDMETKILRKGAVSAKLGEKLLIPINMRDGSLLCEGLGNPEWNYSAPHGAGRLMSRKQAFATLNMEDFRESMSGIYSTSINNKTLDEAPMCYKDMSHLIEHITPTAKILKIIKPIYNFKASGD
jgi:RNA-splicing ligase RtcB